MYRARRRRLLFGVAVILFVAATAGRLLEDSGRGRMPTAGARVGARGSFVSAVSWPQEGEAALMLGKRHPLASPRQEPAPIASLAKVMTAYLVLRRYPLVGAQEGITLTVSADQAEDVARDRAEGQSVVTVSAGEKLTERQLLEALLIPSGNNVARMLGEMVAGSESAFVEEMNREARALGMDHTTYTDPSGWDPATVSTAADQLRVFEQALRFSVFRQIVSMPNVTLPFAGTLANFNPLIADGYAGKTGSDSAAGGCLAFFTQVSVAGHGLTAVGVVMGQGHGSDTQALLTAAGEAAQQLVGSIAPTTATGQIAGLRRRRGRPDRPSAAQN